MRFLWWLLTIAAFGFYGWTIYDFIVNVGAPEFDLFAFYFRLAVVSFIDYILVHHISLAMFDESVAFEIPGYMWDPDDASVFEVLFCLAVIFILAPVTMLFCIIYHIIGTVRSFSDDY